MTATTRRVMDISASRPIEYWMCMYSGSGFGKCQENGSISSGSLGVVTLSKGIRRHSDLRVRWVCLPLELCGQAAASISLTPIWERGLESTYPARLKLNTFHHSGGNPRQPRRARPPRPHLAGVLATSQPVSEHRIRKPSGSGVGARGRFWDFGGHATYHATPRFGSSTSATPRCRIDLSLNFTWVPRWGE
jgi:hypothetical protein